MGPVQPLVDPLPEEGSVVGSVPASATQVPLTVAAVAARLGVAPSTLRTWDRRYGLGPSGRAAGSHRRYTAEDVARLETMRRLTLAGAAPSDAARVAADNAPGLVSVPAGASGEDITPAHVDALTLAAAAAKGEEPRLRRMVASAVRERGLVGAWTDVGYEALQYLAGRDPVDKPGRDPESLLAGAILAAARAYAEAPGDLTGPEVVLWAEPRDLPDLLGAHVLAAALAQRGARARVARAGEGPGRVARVVGAASTAVVAVVGDPPRGEELARAAADRGDVVVFLIGSQAPVVWLPGVHRVRTYAGALHEIVGALVEHLSTEADDEAAPGPS